MKESVALMARVGSQLWEELETREEADDELDDGEEEEEYIPIRVQHTQLESQSTH